MRENPVAKARVVYSLDPSTGTAVTVFFFALAQGTAW
jgi:hypothetical protein